VNSHMHYYEFDSLRKNGHTHKMTGYCEGTLGIPGFHFHFFFSVCSYTNHTHYFSGMTGAPIKTENGHIHKMEGFLESNTGHRHQFTDYTSEEVSCIKGENQVGMGLCAHP
jgi:hypothetical protein